jgi:hypothetical protein
MLSFEANHKKRNSNQMLHKSSAIILIIFFVFSSFAQAKFTSDDSVDEMHGDIYTERYTLDIRQGNYQKLGFYCWERNKDIKIFAITFSSKDNITRPIERVYVEIKVDDGKVHSLNGEMYRDSYRSGWVRFPNESLIEEMRKGSEALVYVYKNGVKMKGKFSLSGSNAAITEVQQACQVKA